MTKEQTERMPHRVKPGTVVGLRYQGKVLSMVKVAGYNHTKGKHEGTVELVDLNGVQHSVPLSFDFEDVIEQ